MIRFNTTVRSCVYLDKEDKFEVTSFDYNTKTSVTERFDYVIVGTGHFSTPYVPDFDGMSSFKGLIIHAHDFRDGNHYKDMNVLCVGASYSAEDIAL